MWLDISAFPSFPSYSSPFSFRFFFDYLNAFGWIPHALALSTIRVWLSMIIPWIDAGSFPSLHLLLDYHLLPRRHLFFTLLSLSGHWRSSQVHFSTEILSRTGSKLSRKNAWSSNSRTRHESNILHCLFLIVRLSIISVWRSIWFNWHVIFPLKFFASRCFPLKFFALHWPRPRQEQNLGPSVGLRFLIADTNRWPISACLCHWLSRREREREKMELTWLCPSRGLVRLMFREILSIFSSRLEK